MVYLVGIFRSSGPEDSTSSSPERTVLRRWGEWGEKSVYIEICHKGPVV